jgi:phage-related protein
MSHAFELQPRDWKNIFTVDLETGKTTYDDTLVNEYEDRLTGIKTTFDGILTDISNAKVDQVTKNTFLPMIKNTAVVDGIKGKIDTLDEDLESLHTNVRNSIQTVRTDISNVQIGAIPNFGVALDSYRDAKTSNEVAKHQYAQQTQHYVSSFTTTIARFAGAVYVVYLAVNRKPQSYLMSMR